MKRLISSKVPKFQPASLRKKALSHRGPSQAKFRPGLKQVPG